MDKKILILTANLLRLINPSYISRARHDLELEETFKDCDTLVFFARIQRLLRRGFTSEEAAKVLDISGEKLRKFLAYGLS